jgi:hypothetical protein
LWPKRIDAADLGLKLFALLSIVFLHSVAMLVIVLYHASEIALLGWRILQRLCLEEV